MSVSFRQLVADLVRSPELGRAIAERNAARMALGRRQALGPDTDIPAEDYRKAVELIGAMLVRFRDEPAVPRDHLRERVQCARVGRTIVGHWRTEFERLRGHLAADRRDLDAPEQRRTEVNT